ncbi:MULTISPECIES: hypothetical protein [unclassified Fibrobacter]|uniref:hypothetical protein n=1 Tax=unclassified Fibrobacter TaxID=2634177 RepID=UPI000D6D00DE|nr:MULTISPECIES: hypothetical protein [unclassified Fibrobacter]PWJ61257.1 hypothetical protein BGX12_12930 [Fibrobacter sp. UWR4]PZW66096.1 hypothetical protein C8E88_102930 [Fibrobacter sp. UWR1]
MKFLKGISALILLLAPTLWAAPKPVTFFGQAGFGLLVSKGDMNDYVLKVEDGNGVKGNLHPATLSVLGSTDFSLGVNIKELSLALNFQHWTSEQNMTAYPDQTMERDTRIMRLGLEFTYNIFWPEFFQAGIGAGISLVNIKTDENLFYGADMYDTDFTGLGFGFIANIHYFITDHIAMVPSLKFYQNCFFTVDADRIENDAMNHNLWQTMILVSLALRYQF